MTTCALDGPNGSAAAFARLRRTMHEVLEYLKKYGQRLDLEIAEETPMPLVVVRGRLTELGATGDAVMCTLTRYDGARRFALRTAGVKWSSHSSRLQARRALSKSAR